jgi:hypothetical protein
MILPNKRAFSYLNVQRTNIWDCIPPDINDEKFQLLPGVIVGDYCHSIRIPQFKFDDVVTIRYGAEKRSYPGGLSISNIEISFICPAPNVVDYYFNTWFRLIVSKEGYYFPKCNYAKNMNVILYDRSGIPTEWLVFHGVFPLNLAEHDLTYDDVTFLKYTVSLNVDSISHETVSSIAKKIL